ncbi:MAG: DUF3880 domain-containing protein [Lachnospiraceae bacterium]|nr:DUF3880 domain-containing protein [Lachnospiraceae bacterium]
MKVLLYDWSQRQGCLYRRDIHDTFRTMGISFDSFQFDFENQQIEELGAIFDQADLSSYDCLFSVNYFPELSNFCYQHNLKYISWGYDCPFNVRNIEKTLGNACNYVFCFDRVQAESYQRQGFDTVYHLPLGINVSRYKKINPSAAQRKKYEAQVSFIGSLYEGQYPALKEICDSYTKGYLEAVINSQQQLYGAYILNDAIESSMVQSMNQHFKELEPNTKFQLDKAGLVHILDQETSRRERLLLLNLLGKRFDMAMYSYQNYPMLQGVRCCGTVDYFDEMPYVFACSKVNLNISVKGIQSGMPLRTLDVMASGGFLLSNYQQELVEYFSYGEDMVVYESMEDAVEKCYYYLENEGLRRQIAINGRKRVLEEHNLIDKIKVMFEVAGLEPA